MNASFRSGMQVHAVPEDERALDARGQPLPWGYAYADSTLNRKQPPVEKGPFGKPVFRQTTVGRRSTATPAPRIDNTKKSQEAAFDSMFNDWKKAVDEKEKKTLRDQKAVVNANAVALTRATMSLGQAIVPTGGGPASDTSKSPTEVLLYGYGEDLQYAAIHFYESVSGGRIYEDYDRYPPNPRFNTFLTTTRPGVPRSLPNDLMRKINTYQGGNHWIKITFESAEAATAACSASPHNIHGYICYAEFWRDVKPNEDVPIVSHSLSSSGVDGLRQRKSSQVAQSGAWNTMPGRLHSTSNAPSAVQSERQVQPFDMSSTSSTASSATATATEADTQTLQIIGQSDSLTTPETPQPKAFRVEGAKRAVLVPASQALLPVAPWSQRTFGHLPLVGILVGGDPRTAPVDTRGGGVIGNVVPRKADGSFDWERSSWYWKICWWMDQWMGTDLCGMKGED